MRDSKLVHILKHFSKKELKRLDDFVSSPYYNKKEEVISLYRFIHAFAPTFTHKKLTKQDAFNHVSPHKKYNEKAIGYWMSDLVKLTESFIATEAFGENVLKKHYHLLEKYNEWGIEKAINATMNTAQKVQFNYPYRDHQFYYNQYLIHGQGNTYFDKQRKHTYDQSLQKAIDYLDLFYLAQKLKYSCEMVNRQNIVVSDYELKLLNEILVYLKNNPHDEIPPVAIYSAILQCLLDNQNEGHFEHFKALLNRHLHAFSRHEARDIIVYAVNYCVGKINQGNNNYSKELLEIYQVALDDETIFDGKFMSPWSYTNIVGAGVRNQQYDWTANFIQSYKNRLEPQFRENAYSYNLAYLHFYKKEFDLAHEALNKVMLNDLQYSVHSRALLLRIYYELDEVEALLSLVDSFKIYLRRNKLVSDSKRQRYLNFIKFTTRLMKIRKGNHKNLEKLKQDISNTKGIANATWLREKWKEKHLSTKK